MTSPLKSTYRILFILVGTLCLLDGFSQTSEISGYVLPKVKTESGSYFTFFIRSEIDTTKSLLENFELLSADTLERVTLSDEYELIGAKGISTTELGDVDVIAVRFVLGDWILFDQLGETNAFVPFNVHVNGKRVISGYNTHAIKFIKYVQPLSLPTQ